MDDFINCASNLAGYYRSDHIKVPMGNDFKYENACIQEHGQTDQVSKC